MTAPSARAGADRCPTVADLHQAADGLLARVRIPGGELTRAQLLGLAALSAECADTNLDLTSRANLQLRGLSAESASRLSAGLQGLGLFPSQTHERARGIMASPLGSPMLQGMVRVLDRAICAAPALAALSGRFLFALDDGSLTTPLDEADLGVIFGPLWDTAQLVIDGRLVQPRLNVETVAQHLVAIAEVFVTARGDNSAIWRIRDLSGGAESVAGELRITDSRPVTHVRLRPGVVDERRVVVAPLGRLDQPQLHALANVLKPDDVIRIAANGRVVLPAADPESLAITGLIVEPDDPRADVSACAGLGCSRARIDIRSIATPRGDATPVHYAACDRKCGQPSDAESVLP